MLALLSPAKTLDFTPQKRIRRGTSPELLGEAEQLAAVVKKLSPKQLGKLMSISEALTEATHGYFRDWQGAGQKQALLAFQGDVYQGLAAEDFSADDFTFAQQHLRILSGLYGVLRPLDLIEPYRLEMGTKLKNPRGKTLYDFWDNRVTEAVRDALGKQKDRVLINLASNEYFRVLDARALDARIITPAFKDYRNGGYKILSFFAKKARGQMARFLVKNRLREPEDLKKFDADGYRFHAELSSDTNWVFARKAE